MKLAECEMCAWIAERMEKVHEINTGKVYYEQTAIAICPLNNKDIFYIERCPKRKVESEDKE